MGNLKTDASLIYKNMVELIQIVYWEKCRKYCNCPQSHLHVQVGLLYFSTIYNVQGSCTLHSRFSILWSFLLLLHCIWTDWIWLHLDQLTNVAIMLWHQKDNGRPYLYFFNTYMCLLSMFNATFTSIKHLNDLNLQYNIHHYMDFCTK